MSNLKHIIAAYEIEMRAVQERREKEIEYKFSYLYAVDSPFIHHRTRLEHILDKRIKNSEDFFNPPKKSKWLVVDLVVQALKAIKSKRRLPRYRSQSVLKKFKRSIKKVKNGSTQKQTHVFGTTTKGRIHRPSTNQ